MEKFYVLAVCLVLNFLSLQTQAQLDTTAGRCCLNGQCNQALKQECDIVGGRWLGPGPCTANLCGACCIYGANNELLRCESRQQGNCVIIGNNSRWYPSPCIFTQCPATFSTLTPPVFIVAPNEKFTATFIEGEDKVQINWENPVPAEPNNFLIARSTNAKDFRIIGMVSDGNSPQLQFTDNYPLPEGYYRMHYKRNGQDYASQIIAVFAVKTGKMQLLPNPSTGKLRILLPKMETFDTDVTIHDATGKMVYRKQLMKGQRPELDVSILPAGTFIVRATQNGVVYVEKLLKH